ncbi:PstS family phosphate ABC transporter substrate-binding protein [Roseomonas rosulenta]|uniref:PstS family phosphate ABC transporter substrate-binding protein n=1 Tax=Roseomonas rosulenta TaxID=2748667 RepID=UPI0018DFAB45|nr:substrate-binding domain-containing protein [Roseomonas rosulenta]
MRHLVLGLLAGLVLLGAGPASAQGSMTLRDRLVIVNSSSTAGVGQLLARSFAERFEGVPTPTATTLGSVRAMEAFCAGIGLQTPDILLVTRRLPRAVVDACAANGVRDIVELQLGLGAVVLAARRGEAMPGLSSRQVYEALAAERAVEEEFIPNPARFWSDLGSGLPRNEIRVILPVGGSGPRALFDDLVMEAGCRYVRDIRLLFEAAYRRSKCITARTDGRALDVHADQVPAALLAAPPGTLAVVSYDQLLASGGNLVAVPLDGVAPSIGAIGSLDYEPARTFFLYAKRQHSRNQQGVGVVRGIHEFLVESTSEHAGGPGGYLAGAGLVPLVPAERAAQRRIAQQARLMSR